MAADQDCVDTVGIYVWDTKILLNLIRLAQMFTWMIMGIKFLLNTMDQLNNYP